MKIISWNVNGLRSIQRKTLPHVVSTLNPDIICVQETKIDKSLVNTKELAIPGYVSYHATAIRKGYSGVATFIRDSLHLNQISVTPSIGIPRFDKEGRFLIHDFKDFILYNCYFPSGTSGDVRQQFKYSFLKTFNKHLQALDKARRNKVIICGDFNICHKEIDIHHPKIASQRQLSGFLPQERAWMDLLCNLGFTDSFRTQNPSLSNKYTWWTYRANARAKNLGWRIDYFFTGDKLTDSILRTDILDKINGSDHCPIFLDLDL